MNYLILVNKNNPLPRNYKVKNLVKVKLKTGGNKEICLEKKCYKNIKKLLKDMNKVFESEIVIDSGYRSSSYQAKLVKELIKLKGDKAYDSLALPFKSEHQTGLAVDIGFYVLGKYQDNFQVEDFKDEFLWLTQNAHHYGFIIRYPLGKEKITGYIYEPWHLRYVGKIAKFLYENELTLEEFYDWFYN